MKLSRKNLPDGRIEVTMKNVSGKIAFFNRLQLRDADNEPVSGTIYSDNFISILPRESVTVVITPGNSTASKDNERLTVFHEGWNSGEHLLSK